MSDYIIISDSSDDEADEDSKDIIECRKPIGVTRSSGVNSPASMNQAQSSSSSSSMTTRPTEPFELLEKRRKIIDSSLEQYASLHNRLVSMEQFMNPSQRQTWQEFASTPNDERISGVDPTDATQSFNFDQAPPIAAAAAAYSACNANLFRHAGYPAQSHSPLPSSPTAYPSSSDYNSFPSSSNYRRAAASTRRAPKRTYRRKKVSKKRRSPKKAATSSYSRPKANASSSRGSSSGDAKPSRARLNMAMKMLKVKRER